MKTIQFMLLAGALAMAGCASTSSQVTDAGTAVDGNTVAKAEKKDDGLVCKRYKPIGSNMTKKVCQTREQAEAESRLTQDRVNRGQGRGGACISCGGDG